MQVLKADTQVDVRMGPFVDVGDGFTPETGVTLAGGGDNADEAELLKHNGAATVDISANAWAAIAGCDGWYDLTLTAGNLDTEGLLDIVIQNDSVHLPVHARFMVVNAAAYDSVYAAAGTDYQPVDLLQINGNSVAGNAATLTLKQLDIQNNAGSAVIMGATGGNGHGLQISGNGTGEGISTTGGATGHGIEAIGGSTSGNGIYAYGQDGNGNGIECKGEATAGGTGSGLVCVASPAGNGITIAGGSTSGDGIHITATDGDGIDSASGGNNHGMRLTGAGTGEGLYSAGAAAGKGGILGISVDTTVNARTSDSVFTINAGSATNSCYVNMICAVYDVSGAVWECRKITGYVGATKQVTVDTAFTFTIQAGTDLVRIIYDTYVLSGTGATAAQLWQTDMSTYTTFGQAGYYQQVAGGRYG